MKFTDQHKIVLSQCLSDRKKKIYCQKKSAYIKKYCCIGHKFLGLPQKPTHHLTYDTTLVSWVRRVMDCLGVVCFEVRRVYRRILGLNLKYLRCRTALLSDNLHRVLCSRKRRIFP